VTGPIAQSGGGKLFSPLSVDTRSQTGTISIRLMDSQTVG